MLLQVSILGFGLILGGVFAAFFALQLFSGSTAFVSGVAVNPVVSALVLMMAIATIFQGVLLLIRERVVYPLFIAGSVALTLQTLFLSILFYWPFFVLFVLSVAGLYLTTEWVRFFKLSQATKPQGKIDSTDETNLRNQIPEEIFAYEVSDVLSEPIQIKTKQKPENDIGIESSSDSANESKHFEAELRKLRGEVKALKDAPQVKTKRKRRITIVKFLDMLVGALILLTIAAIIFVLFAG